MIRITHRDQASQQTALQIEGALIGSAVSILARTGTPLLRHDRVLVLDLIGLQAIDQAGVALLQTWSKQNLRLQGASPYIQLLLKRHGLVVEEGVNG
ncbi:MAG: hypothetical protein GKR89_07775 [Candidatus Latescibacteria bacterium]|nr:hypothetical protein [Candidatus Latescibacterota bacterium]